MSGCWSQSPGLRIVIRDKRIGDRGTIKAHKSGPSCPFDAVIGQRYSHVSRSADTRSELTRSLLNTHRQNKKKADEKALNSPSYTSSYLLAFIANGSRDSRGFEDEICKKNAKFTERSAL